MTDIFQNENNILFFNFYSWLLYIRLLYARIHLLKVSRYFQQSFEMYFSSLDVAVHLKVSIQIIFNRLHRTV